MEVVIMARKTKTERIAELETAIEQLSNQKKQLEAQERERTRKDRTRRLCERGGLLESMLPDSIPLTHDNFKLLLQKTIANDFGLCTLASIKAAQDKQDAIVTWQKRNRAAAMPLQNHQQRQSQAPMANISASLRIPPNKRGNAIKPFEKWRNYIPHIVVCAPCRGRFEPVGTKETRGNCIPPYPLAHQLASGFRPTERKPLANIPESATNRKELKRADLPPKHKNTNR